MGIFPVHVVGMKACCQGIFAVIGKAQQGRKRHTAHAAHKGALLCVETVGPDTLVAKQVEGLVLVGVVGLLEDRDIVDAALMQISVLVNIDRIDLDTDIAKIFARDFDGFSDVLYVGILAALAGEDEDLLHAGLRDHLHFVLDLFKGELFAADLVVAVESAVDAVVLTVVCNINGCKNIHRIAEVVPGLDLCLACHLLQIRSGSGREQGLEILYGTVVFAQGPQNIL